MLRAGEKEVPDKIQPNSNRDPLTCIPDSYTVSGTNDEVERLMIKNFLNTLAEVALSIASRKGAEK